jgi:hypothetical protein
MIGQSESLVVEVGMEVSISFKNNNFLMVFFG